MLRKSEARDVVDWELLRHRYICNWRYVDLEASFRMDRRHIYDYSVRYGWLWGGTGYPGHVPKIPMRNLAFRLARDASGVVCLLRVPQVAVAPVGYTDVVPTRFASARLSVSELGERHRALAELQVRAGARLLESVQEELEKMRGLPSKAKDYASLAGVADKASGILARAMELERKVYGVDKESDRQAQQILQIAVMVGGEKLEALGAGEALPEPAGEAIEAGEIVEAEVSGVSEEGE